MSNIDYMYMYCFKFHDFATDKSTNCLLWLFRMHQLVIYILMKSFLVILLEYHGHVMGYENKWWMIWTQASIISCLVLYELCYMAKTNKLVWPLHSSPLMIIYVTTSMVLSAARIRFTGQFQGYSQWAPNVTEIIIEQTWIKTASLLNL